MSKSNLLRLPLVAALLAAGAAHAELVVLTKQDTALTSPGIPAGSMAAVERAKFNGNITAVKTENFDGKSTGTLGSSLPNPLTIFDNNAANNPGNDPGYKTGSVTAPAQVGNLRTRVNSTEFSGTDFLGRFDTTNPYKVENGVETNTGNWLQSTVGFTVDFGGDFSAFGFYGTDFGDYEGTFSLELLTRNSAGQLESVTGLTPAEVQSLIVPKGSSTSGTGPRMVGENGSLLFYGLYDTTRSYAGVRFIVNQCVQGTGTCDGFDELGFDDFVVGNFKASNDVPEPGSLALVGASLMALAAVRRRRKA